MVRVADCPDDTVGINSIRLAFEKKSPVAVIAGRNHPHYTCTPPAAYAVLDFFYITDLWKEKELNARNEYVKVWRFRFEKIDLNKISWWHPNGPHISDALAAPRPIQEVCETCTQMSTQVFSQGWTCLNHKCRDYYSTLAGLLAKEPKCLTYDDAFINQRNPNKAALDSLKELSPPIPDFGALGSHGTDLVSRCGFVCPDCGCCSRRVFWNRLVCENSACGFVQVAHMLPYPQSKLDEENKALGNSLASRRARNGVNEGVDKDNFDLFASVLNRGCITMANDFEVGGYKLRQYILPDHQGRPIGSFSLFISNSVINAKTYGPTYMFNELENVDIGLRRNTVAGGSQQYEGLSRHFQQNFVSPSRSVASILVANIH